MVRSPYSIQVKRHIYFYLFRFHFQSVGIKRSIAYLCLVKNGSIYGVKKSKKGIKINKKFMTNSEKSTNVIADV